MDSTEGLTIKAATSRGIFKNPGDKTKVTLVFGIVSEEDILLKKELHDLENTYPQRFRCFYVLHNPALRVPVQFTSQAGYPETRLVNGPFQCRPRTITVTGSQDTWYLPLYFLGKPFQVP
ncbi:uncharacterized protein N7515_009075 [Penicillium bovifimosum]|uniref:NADH-cytochrome b5 reductase 2 n=1 Tax=Penicillium bovifimosum TaxID=126998 RepID=A0A9W9GIV0_9EURO|nr:uncharacterized protein N7515_009075 [Penicillium bovifimosum]KAJ5121114.1 hypothetical protein N7515_009075 [Penicillium bovifimosum]